MENSNPPKGKITPLTRGPFNTFITRKTNEKEDNDNQDYDHHNDGNNENYDKENNDGKNDDNVSKVLRVPEALLLIAPACYYSQTQLLTPTKHKSLNYKSMQENTSGTEHEPLIIKPNTNSTRAF